MLKTTYRTLIFAVLFFFFSVPLFAQNISDTFALESYKVWRNSTKYTKTYVVNQRHADANDGNPGTEDKPLLTINKAAQLVKPGERVLIYSGVYRETIRPRLGGLNADKMISYESAPGEEVIIKGSRMLDTEWIQRRVKTDVLGDTSLTYTWSRKIWVAELPDSIFESNYYPYQLPNIFSDEYKLMPWANLVKELAPYNLSRGMIFQNGKRM